MHDHQTEAITIDHASLVLAILGKSHALSFTLGEKNSKLFHQCKQFARCSDSRASLELL